MKQSYISPFLPNVKIGNVLGLLDVLYFSYNRYTDVYRLAEDYDFDLDEILNELRAAELLGLVQVEGGDVMLTDLGEKVVKEGERRRELLRERLVKVEPFKTAMELLSEKGEFTLGELVEELKRKGLLRESGDEEFKELNLTLIEWGVYSGLFHYSSDEGKFYIMRRSA
ncbi:MAG: ABC transporter ATP-binding protein [Thermofilum sp. ex4484_15]|nr:MAG: ABC transporter ATP-binding protein [Thermofilum sp. ex4484_15]